jgi:hypothetical protein
LKLWELFSDRVEEGPIDNAAFAALLAKIAEEFEAAQPTKRRRGGRRRGRPAAAPIEPQVEEAPAFDVTELR